MNPSKKIDLIQEIASSLLKRVVIQAPLIHSNEISKDLDALEKEIQFFIENKESLRDIVPLFLLRRWTVASFRMALKKIKSARKYSIRYDDRFAKQSQFAALWAYQACGLTHTINFVRKISSNLGHFTLNSPHIEKGDVVLSYKSSEYLKHNILSKIISLSTGSHITHALMGFNNDGSQTLASASAGESLGLGTRNVSPEKGELFIIMRYIPSINGVPKENVVESMESLYNIESPKASFAEFKSWIALVLGSIYVITAILFERSVCLPNPIKGESSLFCSEFVDDVFRRAGMYVSPRSEYTAVVSPVELFYSPLLEFKGIIFNPEDRETFIKEFSKTFDMPLKCFV